MEIIILFVVLLLGVLIGWRLRESYATYLLNKFLVNTENAIEEVTNDVVIPVNIEKHNDHYYVYRKEDGTFMGQGASQQELEEVLKERFPGKKFTASEEMLREVGFLS